MTQSSILNTSLPGSLKQYVKERVTEKQYGNVSEYIRILIRRDQKQQQEERLEQRLLDGLASGSRVISPKEWAALKKDILATVNRYPLERMHYSFRLTGEAEQDLHDIARYIAPGHPEAVEWFLANFEAVCDELCVFPGLGAASPFRHHPTLREVRRYLVTGFEIFGVLPRRQDRKDDRGCPASSTVPAISRLYSVKQRRRLNIAYGTAWNSVQGLN